MQERIHKNILSKLSLQTATLHYSFRAARGNRIVFIYRVYFYNTVYSNVVHKCQQQGTENRINSFPSQKQSCKHLSSQRHKRIVTFLRSFDITLRGGAIHKWWERSLLKVNGAPSSVFRYVFAVPFCFSSFTWKGCLIFFLKFGLGITMGYLIPASACKP